MKKTDNYSLPQWEKQDFIKMEDFNDAFGKTDAALKAHDTALKANADAAATGLNAEIIARGEAVAALSKNLGAAGHNCRIAWGSYTGTGTSGSDAPVELVSGFKPMLLMLVHGDLSFFRTRRGEGKYKEQEFTGTGGSRFYITWEDTKVSWYSTATPAAAAAEGQANTAGEVYHYLLLGFSENAES